MKGSVGAMEFGYLLNDYLHRLGCTAKALADASGVSAIQLSRWRNGSRRPSDEMLRRIAMGIAKMSGGNLEEKEVLDSLIDSLPETKRVGNGFGMRLDLLLDALKIRNSEISRILNFDPSYLSRIRAGKRNPSNVEPMIDSVSRYIARRCASGNELAVVEGLIGAPAAALENVENYRDALAVWLRSGGARPIEESKDAAAFLEALEGFDLNEFLSDCRSDEGLEPLVPRQIPRARSVTGIKNLLRCEMGFFRATALSDSTERILIYSDLPPVGLKENSEQMKRWMQAIARLTGKGLEIVIIYDMERPLDEIIQSLGMTIPLFMTGRVRPVYLSEGNKGPFRHLLFVSGAAVLSGESISGHYDEGVFHLSYDAGELYYCRKRAEALLEKSQPLMEIYTEKREDELQRFLNEEKRNGFQPAQIDIPAFRNIVAMACHGRWAIVSKETAPRVSFLSRHPKLIDALEQLGIPSVDR